MHITIPQTTLARALSGAGRAVATRSTLPVLSNVLLAADAESQTVTAIGTNLSIAIAITTGATVHKGGAFTLPARLIADLVSQTPADAPLALALDEGRGEVVVGGAGESRVKGLAASEFPQIAPIAAPGVVIPGDAFRALVARVAFAAAKDESRPILTGCYLVISGDTATLSAADGFRLNRASIRLETPATTPLAVLIPAPALVEAQRHAADMVPVEISVDRARVQLRMGDVVIMGQQIEGSYPAVDQIIPKSHSVTCRVLAPRLAASVRRAAIFARDGANIVRLSFAESAVTVAGEAAEVGGNVEVVPATTDGEAMTIAFNGTYLLEMLGAAGNNEIVGAFAAPTAPGAFRVAGDDSWVSVLMPMHIGGGN